MIKTVVLRTAIIGTVIVTLGCAHQAPPQIAVPIKNAERSIVSVRYTQEGEIFFSRQVRRYYTTTGFYIDKNIVVTSAYYLLAEPQPADLAVRDGDLLLEVKNVHYYPDLRILILRVAEEGKPLTLTRKRLDDEPIQVVGLEANKGPIKGASTLKWRAISARQTKESQELNHYFSSYPLYFIDKPVPYSLLGSPVIDAHGEVIGIATTSATPKEETAVLPAHHLFEVYLRLKWSRPAGIGYTR